MLQVVESTGYLHVKATARPKYEREEQDEVGQATMTADESWRARDEEFFADTHKLSHTHEKMLRVRKCVLCGVLFAVCPPTLFFHHHRVLEQVFSSLPVRARLCFHTQVSSSPTRTPHVTETQVCRTVRLKFTIWRHLEDWTRLAFVSLC